MAETKKDLLAWLSSIPHGALIGIDDGGLCLHVVGNEASFEIGGMPDECGIEGCHSIDGVQSTYCGSMCLTCLEKHCKECGVCAKDFA
jgi:hypothetical protein